MYLKRLLFFALLYVCVSLISAQEIRIMSSEEAPTNYTVNGQFSGMTTEIVREILNYLEMDVDVEVYPWARSYEYAKNLPNVAIFTAAKTQERIDYGFHFVGPVTTRKYILYKKKGVSYNIASLDDVVSQQLKIGAMRGDWRSQFFKNLGLDVFDVTHHKDNIRALIRGNIDLWVLSDIEILIDIYKAGLDVNEIENAFVFRESQSYIMFSKDTSAKILTEWRNALKAIQKSNFFYLQEKKWSDILGVTIKYKNNTGYYITD